MQTTRSISRSAAIYDRAAHVLPGGTTRATIECNPIPLYIDRGEGPWLIDVDGNRYLDLNNNFTTLIHGNAFPPIVEALERQVRLGTCFANPTEHEIALAELLCDRIPTMDRIRFVNTGTEAVMFAIKAARAFTKRTKVAKLEGAYHGAYDWAEISLNSNPDNWGNLPASVPTSTGTPQTVLDEVVAVPINDVETTISLLASHADELSCLLIDPVPMRAGLIPLEQAYITAIRDFTREHGILLISDEVLNFRQGYNGAAARFGFEPDLTTLGKIIGGGLPIGAIGGPANIMQVFDSTQGNALLPQGGTFSANPLSMVAGLVSMQALDAETFSHLERLGSDLRKGFEGVFAKNDMPFCATQSGSFLHLHARPTPPRSYREGFKTPIEADLFRHLSRALLERGVNVRGGSFIALSSIMNQEHLDLILSAFADALFSDEAVQEHLYKLSAA